MNGKGTVLTCSACSKSWELDEYGYMKALDGETEISHIPDWYKWERQCVKEEIDEDRYGFSVPVDIFMIVNEDGVFKVGEGQLSHNKEGFHLTGCDGQLDYSRNSVSLYTLNSDFYWYKLGDVIGIGDNDALYYCIPKADRHVVAKARLATTGNRRGIPDEMRQEPLPETVEVRGRQKGTVGRAVFLPPRT